MKGASQAEMPSQTGVSRPRSPSWSVISYAAKAPMLCPKRANGASRSGCTSSMTYAARSAAVSYAGTLLSGPRPGASIRQMSQSSGKCGTQPV